MEDKSYSKKRFLEKVNSYKKIICFGIGKRFQNLEMEFHGEDFLDRIICCIDNAVSDGMRKVSLGERNLEVYLPQQMEQLDHTYLILITCSDYEDIINQIEADDNLKNADYYCYSSYIIGKADDAALKKVIPQNIRLSEKPMIPKVLHYCWFGGKAIPEYCKKWMASWGKYCPDYEVIEWNESNYDVKKNAYIYEAYQKQKWAFVSDYARLDVIYHYGGVYLDVDVELVNNIDDLLYQKAFAGFEYGNFVNLGLLFGTIKGLPIIKEFMEDYENKHFITSTGELDETACPILQTAVLEKHGLHRDGEYQNIADMTIFPEKMFAGKSFQTKRTILLPYTKSIHHYDASWVQDPIKKARIAFIEKIMNI